MSRHWSLVAIAVIAALIGGRRASAESISGSFAGSIFGGGDSANVLGLGYGAGVTDPITGSYYLDTSSLQVDPMNPSVAYGSGSLVINLTDQATGYSATFTDVGPNGFFGVGSTITASNGTLMLEADQGGYRAYLDLIEPDLQPGTFDQTFSLQPESGSVGVVAFNDGENLTSLIFSIQSAQEIIPEPSAVVLLGGGLLGMGLLRRGRTIRS